MIVGLGVIIFVHELGHFLLAKWNGVKVEKFSIGFGTPLVAWRRGVGFRFLSSIPIPEPPKLGPGEAPSTSAPVVGETEYAIAMVPLGGYVKMLGESLDEEVTRTTDPRAYPNKSVGARMAIISAGVIMNVIFAMVCFVFIYRNGAKDVPPVIGSVQPGSPAYAAGARPGDEIVAIGTKSPVSFKDLRFRSALSGHGESLRLEIRSPGASATRVLMVEPRIEPGAGMPKVGMGPSGGLTLDAQPFKAPPGMTDPPEESSLKWKGDDKIVAIGPADGATEPVAVPLDIARLLTKYRRTPIQVVVERPEKTEAGSGQEKAERLSVVLPVNRMLDFGLRMEIGPVDTVAQDGLADKAGFRKGDTIVEVDGRTDFDPMRLPLELHDKAGQEVTIKVLRSTGQVEDLRVTPEDFPTYVDDPLLSTSPLNVPALGLCYRVGPKIVAVAPGSPAEAAGLRAGAVVKGARFTSKTKDGKAPGRKDIATFDFDGKNPSHWGFVFRHAQIQPYQSMELLMGDGKDPVKVAPRPVDDWFNPERGIQVGFLITDLPPQGALSAMKMGLDDVTDNALSVFMLLRGLLQGRVSTEAVSGPIGMVRLGGQVAQGSTIEFLRFLAQISMSLAVINFLPIPPLDGGQMVFLIGEKVRGRPLPEAALAPVTWACLAMLLVLMVLITFQDIYHMIKDTIPW